MSTLHAAWRRVREYVTPNRVRLNRQRLNSDAIKAIRLATLNEYTVTVSVNVLASNASSPTGEWRKSISAKTYDFSIGGCGIRTRTSIHEMPHQRQSLRLVIHVRKGFEITADGVVCHVTEGQGGEIFIGVSFTAVSMKKVLKLMFELLSQGANANCSLEARTQDRHAITERYPVIITADLAWGIWRNRQYRGRLYNIGLDGCLLLSKAPLETGQNISLNLFPSSGVEDVICAHVCSVRLPSKYIKSRHERFPRWINVEFTKLSRDNSGKIRAIWEKLESHQKEAIFTLLTDDSGIDSSYRTMEKRFARR